MPSIAQSSQWLGSSFQVREAFASRLEAIAIRLEAFGDLMEMSAAPWNDDCSRRLISGGGAIDRPRQSSGGHAGYRQDLDWAKQYALIAASPHSLTAWT